VSVVDNEEVPPAGDVPGVPKKKGGALIMLIGALVIASVSSAAGATFGPSIRQKVFGGHAPAGEHGEEAEEKEEKHDKGGHIAPLDSLVVDVHDEGGENHHVKVGLALEVAGELNEEEWKAEVVPKARDACISYLRSLKYDEASSSAKFESIRTELQERIAKAVKKPKVKHVFFIDYVVQ
jgi:flagellar basal body-associated protein FliL